MTNDAGGGATVRPAVAGPPDHLSAGRKGLTIGQTLALAGLVAMLAAAMRFCPDATGKTLVHIFWSLFLLTAAWRLIAVFVSRNALAPPPSPDILPRYTVIAALRHEAGMIPQLVARLSRLDYPAERLQGFLVIEADDTGTIAAARACPRPSWLEVLVAPPGRPMTKPRALNIALNAATGDVITVYDAEDEPDPAQLREATARFAHGPRDLACLQAPLRIRPPPGRPAGLLARQFAAEYAALFEITLPALVRLGLPFPLGGTSNHFRVDMLRAIGGWDPWNVTEDADLGFRLWRQGWRLGVMNAPTWETPPENLPVWLPQRTRWLKGYMQTWLVHTRNPLALGWRGLISLTLTLGLALVSASIHAVALMAMVMLVLAAGAVGLTPATPAPALLVLIAGAGASWIAAWVGSRRAGVAYGLRDMAFSPLYWSMLSLAFAHAFWGLIRRPFTWDKTPHTPDEPTENPDVKPERFPPA